MLVRLRLLELLAETVALLQLSDLTLKVETVAVVPRLVPLETAATEEPVAVVDTLVYPKTITTRLLETVGLVLMAAAEQAELWGVAVAMFTQEAATAVMEVLMAAAEQAAMHQKEVAPLPLARSLEEPAV